MQVRSQTTSHERELSKVVIIIGRAGDTLMLTRVKVYCPLHGIRICITNRDPYPTTEAGATPFRFCSFLKVDRATSGRLQGRFPECLGQRWLQGKAYQSIRVPQQDAM